MPSSTPSPARMQRSLRTMAALELFNSFWLAVVLFGFLAVPTSWANVAGYALVAVLLWQGSAYWYLKYRQLRLRRRRPAGLTMFSLLRPINLALLATGTLAIAIGVAHRPGMESWPGLAFGAFAVAEHVNYFGVQLSHQRRSDLRRLARTRRLRRSHLAADLRKWPSADRDDGQRTDTRAERRRREPSASPQTP